MILIKTATDEVRERDKKRKRLLLQVGDRKIHMTRQEALRLRIQLNRFKLT